MGNQMNFTTITFKKLFVDVDVKIISVQKKPVQTTKHRFTTTFVFEHQCLNFRKKGVVANTFAYYDAHKCAILKFQYNFIFQCVAAH